MKRQTVVELIANWAKPEILVDNYNNHYELWADDLVYTLETEMGVNISKLDFNDVMKENQLALDRFKKTYGKQMKRSDMVDYLLLQYQSSYMGQMIKMTDKERMSYLLAKLEKAGMRPTKRRKRFVKQNLAKVS